MAKLNSAAVAWAKQQIAAGSFDASTAWSFTAADGNNLLGEGGDDWAGYAKHFLGVNPDAADETKARWSYPFAKGEKVFRSGLIAIRSRAGQQNEADIGDAAGALIEAIDAKENATKKKSWGVLSGSLEAAQEDLREAISTLGLFGDWWSIIATFRDYVVVCSFGDHGTETRHFAVAYSYAPDGTILTGAITPVDVETVVMPADQGGAGEMATEGSPGMATKGETDDSEPMRYKAIDFKPDAVEATEINGVKGWTFEGYFTTWGQVDREGDVTLKGAFQRSFAEGLPIAKYEHGPTIGTVLAAREDDQGAWVKAFVPEDPATDFIRKLMKIGAVAKMSYGWKPYPGGMRRRADGATELLAVKLFEVSPVAIPMLDATSITGVKAGPNGLPDASLDVQLSAAGMALKAAVDEAEAYVDRRREAGRDLSVKCGWALGELAMDSGEAMLALLRAETKAGQAVAGSRKRFVADMMRALLAFVNSLPEEERSQVEALLQDAKTGGGDKAMTQPSDDEIDALELALLAGEFPGLNGGIER